MLYFAVRLLFLTKLPIFNDEAIYLDWANRIINGTVSPFYPLYDGKQPLLMWIFGVFGKIFPDPLVAGRLVSVLTGLAAMVGIYKLSQKFLNKRAVWIPPAFYIVTSIFSFYDRQALMESSVGAINIWFLYILLKYFETREIKLSVLLGVILGVGFFIKSSVLVFLVPTFLLWSLAFIKNKSERETLAYGFGLFLLVFAMTILPLLIQEQSNVIFLRNERYVLAVEELIRFPFGVWISNLKNTLGILIWYLFPSTFLLILVGLATLFSKKSQGLRGNYISLYLWLFLSIAIPAIVARQVHSRYLVSYLPPLTIPAAYGVLFVLRKFRKRIISFGFIALPLAATLWLSFKPYSYFLELSKVYKTFDLFSYFYGDISGYGISEVRRFLENEAKHGTIMVGVRLDSGNPESAMLAYYGQGKHPRVLASYFDRSLTDVPPDLEYIKSPAPLYFISRGNMLAGMDKYLTELKKIYKKDNEHFVGIYTLKKEAE